MATKRLSTYFLTKFVTNTIRSIAGLDVGDLALSVSSRLGVATLGFPTPTTINTGIATPQLVPLTGAFFYPSTGYTIVDGGAVQIENTGLYTVVYKISGTASTGAADITMSLYADRGSGYAQEPLSPHTAEPTVGKNFTLSDVYTFNASVPNTKLALYVSTAAAETFTNAQAYATIQSLNLIESL